MYASKVHMYASKVHMYASKVHMYASKIPYPYTQIIYLVDPLHIAHSEKFFVTSTTQLGR